MTSPQNGFLSRLFDAVVNYPKDAAFGFYLPPEDSQLRKTEIGLAGVVAGGILVSAMAQAPISGGLLLYAFCHLMTNCAKLGRATRRALDARPQ